jgi:hypothetical protein
MAQAKCFFYSFCHHKNSHDFLSPKAILSTSPKSLTFPSGNLLEKSKTLTNRALQLLLAGFQSLTCDTSRDPPRLLLGLPDSTMPGGRSIAITYAHLNGYIDFPLPDIGGHMVSSRSELIIFGCAEAIRA